MSYMAEVVRVTVGGPPVDDPAGKRRRRQGRRGLELAGTLAVLLCLGAVCVLLQEQLEDVQAADRSGDTLHREAPAAPGRWPTFPRETGSRPHRLLIATHARLLWFNYRTHEAQVLHEGEGIYYGHFPGHEVDVDGAPTTLWVVSRPHNWHPKDSAEWLLQLDINTGRELKRVRIDSRFTHDAIRVGSTVYAASTGTGELLELGFPSMRLKARHPLFTERQHVNTLSPSITRPGHLWAMLHNKGKSRMADVSFSGGEAAIAGLASDVGGMSHGLVHWRGMLLVLDSQSAALLAVDPESEERLELWQAPADPKPFLKGMAVTDDVAYLGVSQPRERSQRNDPSLNSELCAVDLVRREQLWCLELPTHGLLNAISAPHLAVGSGYHANYLRLSDDGRTAKEVWAARTAERAAAQDAPPPAALGDIAFQVAEAKALRGSDIDWNTMTDAAQFVGGKWASGLPFMMLARKVTGLKRAASFLPLLHMDVGAFKRAVLSEPDSIWGAEVQRRDNAYLEGRAGNMEMVKPGVESIHLIFSDGELTGDVTAYRFPFYERYAEHLDRILDSVLGADKGNVIRLQLARMKPGTVINHHQDDGAWVRRGHRIHVPLSVAPGAEFHICGRDSAGAEQAECSQLLYGEGDVFELNNRRMHYLKNGSAVPRIHLVIDVMEAPVGLRTLHRGQVCHYKSKLIVC